eukprot:1158952-Pelagomonas_calceolata.AAC.1
MPSGRKFLGCNLPYTTSSPVRHKTLTGNHDVSGAHDAIGQRVTAAIHVVKLGLGDGVVDVDGGEQQAAHLLQGAATNEER